MEPDDVVLLAEDSEDDLFLMRRAFRQSGVKNRVLEVRDGEEAISYLQGQGKYSDRTNYPLPCVIITDLKMPRLDGFGLLRWLYERPEFRRVPKLVLSSSDEPRDRDEAQGLGACGYFVKPVAVDELVKVVSEINDDWIADHCPLTAG
jgi:CheY-like chemotaxis protein